MNPDDGKNYGLAGLYNLGNTCFMNACIQSLLHIPRLNQFLNIGSYRQKLRQNQYASHVLQQYDDLRKTLWNSKLGAVVRPQKFLNTIQQVAGLKHKDIFTGFAQNDMPEFLIFLFECFHEAIQRPVNIKINGEPQDDTDLLAITCFEMIKRMYSKEYSEFIDMFYGITVSSILDNNNLSSVLSVCPEPFFILDLPIPSSNNKTISLQDCFQHFCSPEPLVGWHNSKTDTKMDATRQMKFWSLPAVLVIDLKRFHANAAGHFVKTQTLIDIPLIELDLSPFIVGYSPEKYIYDLFAICNHTGNVMGGHYTSFVKHSLTGKWHLCNDSDIIPVEDTSQIVTPYAYCLFYQRRE